jgi:hypothetical protein
LDFYDDDIKIEKRRYKCKPRVTMQTSGIYLEHPKKIPEVLLCKEITFGRFSRLSSGK